MNRRDFLKMALAATSYLLVVGCDGLDEEEEGIENELEATAVVDKSKRRFDLIVIGAGVAGLAAARTLADGEYELVVLEGRDRIGGRLFTDRSWDIPLDMGASWIHHIDDNPITELAQQFDMKMVETDYDSMAVYHTDGTPFTDEDGALLEGKFAEILETIAEEAENLDEDVSIQDAINYIIADMNLSREELRLLNYVINASLEHEFAADSSEMSTFYIDEGSAFKGEDVLFPDGYDQLSTKLAKGLDIRLAHIVEEIIYGDDGVTVRTNQGEFQADGAIVTLPLGVLKRGTVHFSPGLPQKKKQAIERLGMGVLNKVYLRFPAVFWDEEVQLLGYVNERKGEWSEYLNIAYYLDAPILLAFNAGRFGTAVEQMSDKEIVAEVMKVLRTMYGNDIPDPTDRLISRWHSDPFAHGAYSFIKIGATPQDRKNLAEQVGPLFFAGEATSVAYAATVHGAYLSGLRVAEEVVAYEEE